jgi:hypothetical protein
MKATSRARLQGFVRAFGFVLFWVIIWLVFDRRGLLLCGLGFNFGLFVSARMANEVLNDLGPNDQGHL